MADYGYSAPYRGMSAAPLPPGFMEAATAPGRYALLGSQMMTQKAGNLAQGAASFVERQKEKEKQDKIQLNLAKALAKAHWKDMGYANEAEAMGDSNEGIRGRAAAYVQESGMRTSKAHADAATAQAEATRAALADRERNVKLAESLQNFVGEIGNSDDIVSGLKSAFKKHSAAVIHPNFPHLLSALDGFVPRQTTGGLVPGTKVGEPVGGKQGMATGPNSVTMVDLPPEKGEAPAVPAGYEAFWNGKEWQAKPIDPAKIAMLNKEKERVASQYSALTSEVASLEQDVKDGNKYTGPADFMPLGRQPISAKLKAAQAKLDALKQANPWLAGDKAPASKPKVFRDKKTKEVFTIDDEGNRVPYVQPK
jgi:hypothetical protein